MKLSTLEKFEIQAEAFHIMTGTPHPGKDANPHCAPRMRFRNEEWDAWIKEHALVVIAMMAAIERTLPE